MFEEYISDLEWPDDDPELEASIGRAIIAWGVLERTIDMAIEKMYDLDSDLASCITSNLGTKGKLDAFQNAFHSRADDYKPKATIEMVDNIINETSRIAAEHRNFLAHGQPFLILYKEEPPLWTWARPYARKGPKYKLARLDKINFDHCTEEIKAIQARWKELILNMEDGFKFREWCKRC